MSVGVVSISGFNFRALVAYCRFADAAGFKIHLWAKDPADPVFYTKYAHWVHDVRQSPSFDIAALLKFIEEIKRKYDYQWILLLPISEYFNRFILDHKEILNANNVIVPLVAKPLYQEISDKYSFGLMCHKHGFSIPQEVEPLEQNIPFVAKPRTYGGANRATVAKKPYLLRNNIDLRHFRDTECLEDFYFQEFVAGHSYYLLLFLGKDGESYRFSQQNLIQQYNGRSIIAASKATCHHERVCDEYIEMLKRIGFHGLIMIELKFFKKAYYMIEANPRIWGPSQLVVDSGGEIIKNFFIDNGVAFSKSDFEKYLPRHDHYYWSGGLVEDAINQNPVSFHEEGKDFFFENYDRYAKSDVFLRIDTIDLYIRQIQGEF